MPYSLQDALNTLPEEVKTKYDFSKAVYTNALAPIEGISCSKHGLFKQYSGALRRGVGCPTCGAYTRGAHKVLRPEEYIRRCIELHRGFYDYSETVYTRMNTKVQVICPLHGKFSINARDHVYKGSGCPVCGDQKRGKRTSGKNVGALAAATSIAKHAKLFESRARAIHGDKYDYTVGTYLGMRKKLAIRCIKHDFVFQQGACDHITKGYGCPKCGCIQSTGETQVASFLSTFTTVDQRNRQLIKPKEVDIYLPEHKLAIEYCGEYHHSAGSKEEEGKMRRKHIEKHMQCRELGVRLITMYESEWQERNYAIRRLLRNAVGKGKGRLMARKCELRKVSNAEARAFYDRYHPQGGAGSGEHYALFWKGKMVACMRFVLGANDRGSAAKARVWTLGRYATRITVAGAASRLFKAFLKDYNPPEVKSFSDNRYFDGGMYAQLGFTLEEETKEDYLVWSPKQGLRPKPHYQRRQLPKRMREHGVEPDFDPATDPRTEAEITYLIGCRRIYDCGKKRWVYKAGDPQ